MFNESDLDLSFMLNGPYYSNINPEWGLDPEKFDHVYMTPNLDLVRSDWTSDPLFYPTTIVYSLAFLIGIFGNSVVIFALVGDRKAHNVTNSFLVSLAIADILFLAVCIPYETVAKFSGYLSAGQVLCKVAGFVEMLTAAASIWNLTIVSIERYIVIVHPMKSRTLCTFGRTKKIIVVVWVAAALMSVPYSHVLDTEDILLYNNESYVAKSNCADSNFGTNGERIVFAWYQLCVMFIVPSCIMAYCYFVVIRVLWLSTRRLAHMTGSGGTQKQHRSPNSATNETSCMLTLHPDAAKRNPSVSPQRNGAQKKSLRVSRIGTDQSSEIKEARKQVIKMLLTIIIVFLICWGPKLILNVMKRHEPKIMYSSATFTMMLVINLLPYLQSAMNPLIYSFMSNNFRRSMRSSMQRHCPCWRKSNSSFDLS